MSDNFREGKFFAWAIGLRGLIPVKYHEGINATEAKRVIQSHEIPDLSLSFGQLAKMFPAPVSEEYPVAWPDFRKVQQNEPIIEQSGEGQVVSKQPEQPENNPGIYQKPDSGNGIFDTRENGNPVPFDNGQRLRGMGPQRMCGPGELQQRARPKNSLRRRFQKALAAFRLPPS